MLDNTSETPQTRQWSKQERVWCIQRYIETKSLVKTQTEFLHVFEKEFFPTKSAIFKMVKKFQSEGTVENLNSKSKDRFTHSGRKSLCTSQVISSVRESVEQSPKRSTRKRCQSLSISRSTMMRVIKKDLGMFPYRIQIHQKLSSDDKIKRLEMAKVLAEKIEKCGSFLMNLWTTDEAHFHLDGQVNSKNNVYWGTSPPNEVAEKPLHSSKVTVWVTISSRGIIGPFFFEKNGLAETVNTELYVEVLGKFMTELRTKFKSTLGR